MSYHYQKQQKVSKMSLSHRYPHPYIAREGHPYIVLLLLICWGASFLNCWLLNVVLYLVTLFVIQFFRDPARNLPNEDELSVLSPADGRVIVVEKARDPFRNQDALKISIFMNVFNVHSNRIPVAGVVEKVVYHEGNFVNASVDKASTENERNAILLRTHQGQAVTFVQVAGLVARRIICYAKKGNEVARGERYGFIRFGSRVDLYLPIDAEAKVVIGDKVKATSSILAQLASHSTDSGKG